MTNDLAYTIKKDIKNNPVFRETDHRQKREFVRRVIWFVLAVTAVIFSVRQQNALRLAGYSIEKLTVELEAERSKNRQLQLNLETFESPKKIEEAARKLGLRPPSLNETLVLERVPAATPSSAIVARAE
jgi:cell division protein FtsL